MQHQSVLCMFYAVILSKTIEIVVLRIVLTSLGLFTRIFPNELVSL